jgi:hypothetical protein
MVLSQQARKGHPCCANWDHWFPLKYGGLSHGDNIVPLNAALNNLKKAKCVCAAGSGGAGAGGWAAAAQLGALALLPLPLPQTHRVAGST